MLPLPPEIFDQIFSFLQSDSGTLKACQEAYPLLCDIIEPHLYAHITIHNLNPVNQHSFQASDFVQLLSDKPRIPTYAHSLQIVINWPGVVPRRRNCSFQDEEIIPIFSLLPRLMCLTLWSRGVSWNLLRESFRMAFGRCLRLLSVKEASIQGFQDFPLSTFNGCKSLISLSLDGKFKLSYQSENTLVSNKSSYPALESLSIHNCPNSALNNITTWLNPSRLHSLDVRFGRMDEFQMLPLLIHGCSATLTSLELGFGRDLQKSRSPYDRHDYINLSFFPLLENLTLHISLSCSPIISDSPNRSSLPGVTELLRTVPLSSSLKRLVLHFHFQLSSTFVFEEMNWSRLTLLPHLYVVHPIVLRISVVQSYTNIPAATVLQLIESDADLMPMVWQGVLVVSVEDSGCGYRRGVLSHGVLSGSSPRVLLPN